MMNCIVLIWLFDLSLFLLQRNEFILICECTSDYLKIAEIAEVEDRESMIEQKKIEDNCDHRDFNELYSFDDGYYIRRRI